MQTNMSISIDYKLERVFVSRESGVASYSHSCASLLDADWSILYDIVVSLYNYVCPSYF